MPAQKKPAAVETVEVGDAAPVVDEPEVSTIPSAPAPPQAPQPQPLQFAEGIEVVDPHGANRPQDVPTRTSAESLGFIPTQQVTVGAPQVVGPRTAEPRRTVRLSRNVEEMTIVSGGRSSRYDFSAGHEYNVPISVAIELDRIGAIYSIGAPTAPTFVS